MQRLTWSLLVATLLLAGGGPTFAQARIEVTITNLTRGQPFSPPVVASHGGEATALFVPGEPASAALAAIAEDGDTRGVVELLEGDDAVEDVVVGRLIPPGGTIVLTLAAPRFFRHVSLVGMLENTNDGFYGLQGARPPLSGNATLWVPAWDAGSEANNESCDFVPGPACGSAGFGVRDVAGAEGFVHVHAGIQGLADAGGNVDLAPERDDWRNPVAQITLRRIRATPDSP